ncbi:MAG: histidine phosphatase family protein [Oleiphilus sp.]
MSKIILVRHAQASLGKTEYDQLSDLGFTQAKLLGEYFAKTGQQPKNIIHGSLKRHQQTANTFQQAQARDISLQENPDWNEFDFKKLIQLYLEAFPKEVPEPGNVRAFFSILKKSMLAWSEDQLDHQKHTLESWHAFSARISRALNSIPKNEQDEPTIVVTSGGAIAMLMANLLRVSPRVMIDMNFQIRNTSFSEIIKKPHKEHLVAFNQINHLIDQQDSKLITFA